MLRWNSDIFLFEKFYFKAVIERMRIKNEAERVFFVSSKEAAKIILIIESHSIHSIVFRVIKKCMKKNRNIKIRAVSL